MSLKVLVVEDDPVAAGGLAELLRLWGHEASVAPDGETALEMVADLVPTVVLVDIGLPGLNGYGLARRLRAAFHKEQMVLVALTGSPADDRADEDSAPFDHRLQKPIDIPALQRLLTQLVPD
jgi:two-component system CheB/CheR fusion protein